MATQDPWRDAQRREELEASGLLQFLSERWGKTNADIHELIQYFSSLEGPNQRREMEGHKGL
jgi:hypothetical protein